MRLTNLNKSYHGQPILREISFDVPAGQTLTVLGPSGGGKTTLLRLIAGFEQPDRGDISLDGCSLLKLAPHQRAVGMCFQDFALWPHLTVMGNLTFCLPRDKAAVDKARRLLERVGLSVSERRSIMNLSGGEKQRLALARSVIGEPAILLLDEPFSQVDPLWISRLWEIVHQLQQRRQTRIVYVTHDQQDAALLSSETLLLHEGSIVQRGALADMRRQPANDFVRLFLGSAAPVHHRSA